MNSLIHYDSFVGEADYEVKIVQNNCLGFSLFITRADWQKFLNDYKKYHKSFFVRTISLVFLRSNGAQFRKYYRGVFLFAPSPKTPHTEIVQ